MQVIKGLKLKIRNMPSVTMLKHIIFFYKKRLVIICKSCFKRLILLLLAFNRHKLVFFPRYSFEVGIILDLVVVPPVFVCSNFFYVFSLQFLLFLSTFHNMNVCVFTVNFFLGFVFEVFVFH